MKRDSYLPVGSQGLKAVAKVMNIACDKGYIVWSHKEIHSAPDNKLIGMIL